MTVSLLNFQIDGNFSTFSIALNDLIFPEICVDRDHSIDVGRIRLPDFDEHLVEIEYFEALPSDGFPAGFRPFIRVKGNKGAAIVVWGPGGMLPNYFQSVGAAMAASKSLVDRLVPSKAGSVERFVPAPKQF